jgi:hypothetical protein
MILTLTLDTLQSTEISADRLQLSTPPGKAITLKGGKTKESLPFQTFQAGVCVAKWLLLRGKQPNNGSHLYVFTAHPLEST